MKIKNLGTISIIFILLLSTTTYSQWEDCPFGLENDPYPGECGRYIDSNSDGLCDHSQQDPSLVDCINEEIQTIQQTEPIEETHFDLITGKELKTKTVQEVADIYEINSVLFAQKVSEYVGVEVKTTDSFQLLHDNYGAEPSIIKDVAALIKTNTTTNNNEEKTIVEEKKVTTKSRNPYVVVPIFIVAIILYLVSFFLTKKKIFQLRYHLKLWNYLLLFSFLVSGGLGIMLVLRINYGWFLRIPFNMLFWHVEFGITMAVLTIFHVIWYMPVFRKFFRFLKTN